MGARSVKARAATRAAKKRASASPAPAELAQEEQSTSAPLNEEHHEHVSTLTKE